MDEELKRAGVRRPENTTGIGWAGPTLLHAGTRQQQDRYLLPLLAGALLARKRGLSGDRRFLGP